MEQRCRIEQEEEAEVRWRGFRATRRGCGGRWLLAVIGGPQQRALARLLQLEGAQDEDIKKRRRGQSAG